MFFGLFYLLFCSISSNQSFWKDFDQTLLSSPGQCGDVHVLYASQLVIIILSHLVVFMEDIEHVMPLFTALCVI